MKGILIQIKCTKHFGCTIGASEIILQYNYQASELMMFSKCTFTLLKSIAEACELFVSIEAVIKGVGELTLGNIIGSNIANILFAIPLVFC